MKLKQNLLTTILITMTSPLLIFTACEEEEYNNTAPTCKIISPVNGAKFTHGEIISIAVEATDEDNNLKEVCFYVNDVSIGSSNLFPYNFDWNTNEEEPGFFTIKVTAIDEAQKKASEEIHITLETVNPAPVAAFTAVQTTISEGKTVNFTDQSTNNPTSWSWNFGDGNGSNQANPSHTYNNASSYTIQLTVSNDFGSDTETKRDYITVEVEGLPPVADFRASPTILYREGSVVFSAISNNNSTSWSNLPNAWSWNFGDGNTSTEASPSHTYNNAGIYTVELTVSNDYGFDTETKTDYITVNEITDVLSPATGKIWMDRNLGATRVAQSGTDPQAFGDLYQWGRAADGHQTRRSNKTTIQSNSDDPEHSNFIIVDNNIGDWRNPQNENLWQALSNTNNPCPSGYRLPTEDEWAAERESWDSNDAAGAFASPLKLTTGGYRNHSDGTLRNLGSFGHYWTSTVDSTSARKISFTSLAYFGTSHRAHGFSVRCIKE